MMDFDQIVAQAVNSGSCLWLTLSKRGWQANVPYDKLTMRPVVIRQRPMFQFTMHENGQQTHENVAAAESLTRIQQLLGAQFEHAHLFTTEADFVARTKRDGRILIKKQPPTKQSISVDHDRSKNYLIPEGTPCPFLAEIGVMTDNGKVRAQKYHKFRQINRFLELVDDVMRELPSSGTLRIVDFGCGKSYLTFALYHLITKIHDRNTSIVGLDWKDDVVQDCNRISKRLQYDGLEFRVGDIANYEPDHKVDMTVSLHACDTATDTAIARSIEWQADVILTVPCCQHELAELIPESVLPSLQQHGILKERFAALATDALRAKALEACGYSTQVVEFIDLEHTAKNVLIRAVRDSNPLPDRRAKARDEYHNLQQSLQLSDCFLNQLLEPQMQQSSGPNL